MRISLNQSSRDNGAHLFVKNANVAKWKGSRLQPWDALVRPQPLAPCGVQTALKSVIIGNGGEPKRTGMTSTYPLPHAEIAQLVERQVEALCVRGSTPLLGTSSMKPGSLSGGFRNESLRS